MLSDPKKRKVYDTVIAGKSKGKISKVPASKMHLNLTL